VGNTRALAHLASPGQARRGETMGAGARCGHEYYAKIRSKASQARDLLLSFATSPCLIHFDRDRYSQLRDAITLGGSSLQIRAAATVVATRTTTKNTNTSRLQRFCCCAAEREQVSKTIVLSDPASGEGE
jgi:hypothetical protein